MRQTCEEIKQNVEENKASHEEYLEAKATLDEKVEALSSNDFVFIWMKALSASEYETYQWHHSAAIKSFVFGGTVGALIGIPLTSVFCHRRIEMWKAQAQSEEKDPKLWDKISGKPS